MLFGDSGRLRVAADGVFVHCNSANYPVDQGRIFAFFQYQRSGSSSGQALYGT